MNLYDSTASALRYGVTLGIVIMALGVVMDGFDISYSDDVLWFGTLVLILSPLFGVIVSTICLALEKDWKWVSVASVLLAVTIAGMIVSWVL